MEHSSQHALLIIVREMMRSRNFWCLLTDHRLGYLRLVNRHLRCRSAKWATPSLDKRCRPRLLTTAMGIRVTDMATLLTSMERWKSTRAILASMVQTGLLWGQVFRPSNGLLIWCFKMRNEGRWWAMISVWSRLRAWGACLRALKGTSP